MYTEDAKVYVGKESMDIESPRTYISREDGMWVSITLLGTDMVRGLVEDQGQLMEIMPADYYEDLETAMLLERYQGVSPPHIIRWIDPTA